MCFRPKFRTRNDPILFNRVVFSTTIPGLDFQFTSKESPGFRRYPSSFLAKAVFFCSFTLRIIGPSKLASFWGPKHPCVIQVGSPFQDGGSFRSSGYTRKGAPFRNWKKIELQNRCHRQVVKGTSFQPRPPRLDSRWCFFFVAFLSCNRSPQKTNMAWRNHLWICLLESSFASPNV